MATGMGDRLGDRTWRWIFAAGLILRPILILPMAPSGPLSGSDLLLVGLIAVFAAHVLIAAGVLLGNRLAIALGILSAIAGLPIATIGLSAGLPMPWPVILAGYNIMLAVIGIRVWEESGQPTAR